MPEPVLGLGIKVLQWNEKKEKKKKEKKRKITPNLDHTLIAGYWMTVVILLELDTLKQTFVEADLFRDVLGLT